MPSSGTLRRAALVRTDVSEELASDACCILTTATRRNITESQTKAFFTVTAAGTSNLTMNNHIGI
jgi:hypothetical protein